jgi:hypothetical protein
MGRGGEELGRPHRLIPLAYSITRDNELYAGADQVRRQFRHPVGLEFRPAIFDDEVLPLGITALAHSFEEALGKNARTGSGGQPADPPNAIGLLRARRERPRRC